MTDKELEVYEEPIEAEVVEEKKSIFDDPEFLERISKAVGSIG